MALIGTHIRFALDIKNDFGVKNLDKYISGAVYPDSRYLTKIDRKITHWTDIYNSKFCQNDDFKKGWMSHLIYDRIQGDVFEEIFPELFKNFKEEKKILSPENWVLRTSLKILQDLDDIEIFNIKNYLKCLEYFETPNKERNEVIEEYNQMFVNIYQKDKVEILDLVNMWVKFEIKKELTDWIEKKTNQFSLDGEILKKIPLVYPATIRQYHQEMSK